MMVAPRVADELTGIAHGSPVIGFSLGNQASSNGQLYVVQMLCRAQHTLVTIDNHLGSRNLPAFRTLQRPLFLP